MLAAAGFEFEVAPAEVDERRGPGEDPRAYVARLADAKAAFVAARHPGRVVLGADTVVVLGRQLLGKPLDDEDAARMLRELSGTTHQVLTGLTIRRDDRCAAEVEVTQVRFVELSHQAIVWYVATGEPRGKAGAYAIQGRASRFIDRIEGSYANVVGLPVATVNRLLGDMAGG